MDINELLTTARFWIGAAQDKETSLDEAAQCAEIAQACAQTAQAMILHTATSKGTDINEIPAFWFRVDSGN